MEYPPPCSLLDDPPALFAVSGPGGWPQPEASESEAVCCAKVVWV